MVIKRADMEDAPEILILQKLAYRSEADIHGDDLVLPMTQSINEINTKFSERLYLKTTAADNRIVGSIRTHEKEGT